MTNSVESTRSAPDHSFHDPSGIPSLPTASIPAISADAFKTAFRGHPGGVGLVTAISEDGRRVALTATSVASISADPPLLIFSVSALSSSAAVLTTVDSVVVHLLDADHLDLARLGANRGIDRFADREQWRSLPTGEPVFDGPVWLRCIVVDRLGAGGATVIVAEPVETNLEGERANVDDGGLVYHQHRWHRLGLGSRIEDPQI